MNLKKLFATSAVFVLAASLFAPAITNATFAGYDAEVEGAYDYAYSRSVTTLSSVTDANPFGEAIRGHVAKMMSNWSLNVLKLEPKTDSVPSFNDLKGQSDEIKGYITKSAQQGLMGRNPDGTFSDSFRPEDNVTRAEFGTLLSRALWGTANDGGSPYYTKHLEALKDAKIMKNLSNPERPVLRYEIWLMLKRSEALEDGTTSSEVDPMKLLACLTDETKTVEECNAEFGPKDEDSNDDNEDDDDDEVKNGDLDISVVDYSKSVRSIAAKGVAVFNTLKLSVSDTISLESLTLERVGLSDKSAIKGVWFEKNGIAVSSKWTLNSKGEIRTRFFKGFEVKDKEEIELVVELDAGAGSEIAFKIIDAKTSAESVDFEDVLTSTYRTAAYAVAQLDMGSKGNDTNYKFGDKKEYEIGRFSLTAKKGATEGKDISLKAMLFKNQESADLGEVLSDVRITREWEEVSKKVELDDKEMRVYFKKGEVIPSGKRYTYIVLAKLGTLDDDKAEVQLQIEKPSRDITAEEEETKQRVLFTQPEGSAVYTLKKYTIEGGKIILAPTKGFPKTVEAGEGSTNVQVAEGKITLAEPIKMKNLKINGTKFDEIENVKLEIDGSSYDGKVNAAGTQITFDEDLYFDETSEIKMFVDIKNGAAGSIEFTDSIKGSAFAGVGNGEYQNNGEKFDPADKVAGAIQIAKVVVKTPQFTLRNTLTSTVKVIKENADINDIFKGKIKATKSKVSIDKLTVSQTAFPFAAGEQVELMLYVNGEALSNATYNATNTKLIFNNLGTIEKGESMDVRIEAQPTVDNVASVIFDVEAEGTDDQSNTTKTNKAKTVKLDIVEKAGISIANANSSSTVVKEGADVQLATFSATVKNGATTLEKVTLDGTYTDIKGEPVLIEFNGITVDWEVNAAGDKIESTTLNENLEPGKYTFVVKSNVNTDGKATGVTLATTKATLTVDGSNSSEKTLSTKYLVVKDYPVLSLVSSKDNTLTVKVVNPNNSDNELTIVGFTVDGNVSSASLNDQTVADITAIDASKQVTLNPGDETEAKLDIDASGTVKVTGIKVQFTDGTTYNYTISDEYTNVAKWGDLKVTYKS